MSTHPNDGGPAFPRPAFTPGLSDGHDQFADAGFANTGSAGMTLRDYFAAAALTGVLTGQGAIHANGAAGYAYEYADAMLAARDRKDGAA